MATRTDIDNPLKTFSYSYWSTLKRIDPVKAEEYRRKMTGSWIKEDTTEENPEGQTPEGQTPTVETWASNPEGAPQEGVEGAPSIENDGKAAQNTSGDAPSGDWAVNAGVWDVTKTSEEWGKTDTWNDTESDLSKEQIKELKAKLLENGVKNANFLPAEKAIEKAKELGLI